jgi:hypothetical protein
MASVTQAADNSAQARLQRAKSLRCTYTAAVAHWIRVSGHTVEQTNDKSTATYDAINLTKGTARIIANQGAGDLDAWWGGGSLWLSERTPVGNLVVTTVFPQYAPGTNEFVVLESRHSFVGTTALGESTYGTCKVLE